MGATVKTGNRPWASYALPMCAVPFGANKRDDSKFRLAAMITPSRNRFVRALVAIALGGGLACAHTTPPTASTGSTGTTGTWTQVWSDEFNGAANTPLDTTMWGFDKGDGCASGICGWGNDEKESYT